MQKNHGIPKVIHYVWFGEKELPDLAKKCIASWKKYCPDYEIREWNESNYDINSCDYIKEAYQECKWAFVSDYARMDILYRYGGLYFDTDVELIRPIDSIIENGSFMGIETEDFNKGSEFGITVNPGLGIAAEPGLEIYKTILECYRTRHFRLENGSLDTTTIVAFVTDILKNKGLQNRPGIQNVAEITIYPKEYFCPMNYFTGELTITENTCSIHHFQESWVGDKEKYIAGTVRRLRKFLPKKIAKPIAVFTGLCRYDGFGAACHHICNRVFGMKGN